MIVNGWFDGINVWKINTWSGLISYVLLILAGALIFFLIIHRINRNRRPDVAMQRVSKRLKRLGGKGSRVYTDFTLRTFAGDLALVSELSEANTADAVLAQDRVGTAADAAAGVSAS